MHDECNVRCDARCDARLMRREMNVICDERDL